MVLPTYTDEGGVSENDKKYQISSLAHLRDVEGNTGKQLLDLRLFNLKSLRIRDLQTIFDFIWGSKYIAVLDLGR
jgi:hypothetical protein